ncbi:MAG: hypothetical protein K0S27_771 [Gammaproteobacteria bacterium]|jgi:general secretion pathway protein K|nr:hypothetical protein [Gammaproteobacteria bacterium]
MLNPIKQRGAAIIVALFVTSLVTIAAITMIKRLSINVRSTELITQNVQATLLAQGSLAWAMEQLNINWHQRKPNQPIDLTPIHSPLNEMKNAHISSIIFDAQGRFNLNNLIDPAAQNDFIRLLMIVYPKISLEDAGAIALAITNWISPGEINNMLDDYYIKATPPYRAPHRLMVSVSEFRLIKGVSMELYSALSPYITVLPESTPININNASLPVLMSTNPTLTINAAKAIVLQAKKTPFPSIQSLQQFDIAKNNPFPENKITAISSYFLVKSSVKINKQRTVLYTLLKRAVKEQKPTEIILWQSKGTL